MGITVEAQGGLLGQRAMGGTASEQVDEDLERTAVMCALDRADVFELIQDRLDQGAYSSTRFEHSTS